MGQTQAKTGRAREEFGLLNTKLHRPTTSSDLVARPHLLNRLDEGLGKKLILISAPPGFGKTTLVGQWLRRGKVPAAWVSLDQGDNDPINFLLYLIAALQEIDPGLGESALDLLGLPQPAAGEPVLITLINDLLLIEKDIVLILDDYHVIESQPVHRALSFLLAQLPPRLHLVVATRSDPPLPLARLRSRDQLVELRAKDLGFKAEETARFFRQRLDLDLSRNEIEILGERTEGWIAGLQLAALSLRKREDVHRFIEDFKGENRLIVDYLLEEVLDRQSPTTREFLLRVSILDRLTPPLCEAVTGRTDSAAMLLELEKSNLFLFPLDDRREWYRFHALFADLLRQRLRLECAARIPELHLRAGRWLVSEDWKEEAVEHFLSAEDFVQAACLIENVAAENWERGPQNRLADWFAALPDMQVRSRPQLGLYFARALVMSGHHDQAEKRLREAETALEDAKDEVVEILPDGTCHHHPLDREEVRGRIAAVRAFLSSYRGDVPSIIRSAEVALKSLPEKDILWRGLAAATQGMAWGWSGEGEMVKAERAFVKAAELSEKAGNRPFAMFCASAQASAISLQGRLRDAEAVFRNLARRAGEYGLQRAGAMGIILAGLGAIRCERNDFEAGLPMMREGIAISRMNRDPIGLAGGVLSLISILIWKGEFSEAGELLREFENLAADFQLPPWMGFYHSYGRMRLLLAVGDTAGLDAWVRERGLENGDAVPAIREPEYIAFALVLMSRGLWREAVELLGRLIEQAEAGHRFLASIQMRMYRALALYGEGESEPACQELAAALALCEPENLIAVFLDRDPSLPRLLEALLDRIKAAPGKAGTEVSIGFVRKVMTAWRAVHPVLEKHDIPEPLSERELEVLRLIAAGLSNRKIAERLFISLNTVRTHTKNIHMKLDVHSRTQAAARAKDLGLL